MPEQIGSNPTVEKEVSSSSYIQIGNVPETGKHQHIKELDSLGLNVPPTLVCDYQSLKTDFVKDWLKDQFKENDLQIRTTTADENRNSPSMRDPSGTFEEFLQVLHDFSIENPVLTFILQGTPKGSINRDILSGNIYRKGNQIVADLWPDLASWSNRINRSPLWRYSILSDGGRNLKSITTEKIANGLWNDILYRRGRMFLKEDKAGKVPPKIEDASPEEPYYSEAIGYAKRKLENGVYPNDIVKYYYDELKEGGNILEKFPHDKIAQMERDMKRLLEDERFGSNVVAKFSVILGDNSEPIYWDLIPQH
jgi:hypothetical protein